MKKILPVFLFVLLFFTSCELHWDGTRFDVPWQIALIVALIVIAPTALICVGLFVFSGITTSKTKYVCPKCEHTFYPKWYKGMWRNSTTSDMVLRCPHCKSKQVCYESYNQDK